jgi:hypothetical protein
MPELTIKYKGAKALKALQELSKTLDIVIEMPAEPSPAKAANLPITFSQNPDLKALAGIWEGQDITLEELRKAAWGDRI